MFNTTNRLANTKLGLITINAPAPNEIPTNYPINQIPVGNGGVVINAPDPIPVNIPIELLPINIKGKPNRLQWLPNVYYPVKQQPTVIVDPPPTTMTTTGFDLQSFISDNKWLLAGGVAILAYFLFFSGGLGASDRTVTDVRRFGRK